MATFHILALPIDVLFHIVRFLSSNDLFSINLTCRALHEICLNDMIWRLASTEIPLDIPLGKSLHDFTGRDLRKLYVKEARLREFWAGELKPARGTKIPSPGMITAVQMLSCQWLLTLSTRPDSLTGAVFELWSLKDLDSVHRVCTVDTNTMHCLGFSAAWQVGGRAFLIAAHLSDRTIKAYSVTMHEGTWAAHLVASAHVGTLRAEQAHMIHVAAHMIGFCSRNDGETKVLLINSITKRQFSSRIPAFDDTLLPVLRVSQDLSYFILVAGSCHIERRCPEQLIHVYDLPANIASTTDTSPESTTDTVVETFDPELRTFFQSSHFAPSSSDTSVMPPDVALDPQGTLYLFQPEVAGNGAHITTFHVDPSIELIQTQKIASTMSCRMAWSSLCFQCACPNRGFFGAGILQPNGDSLHQLYRFSHQLKGGGVVLVPLEELVQSEIAVAISHDDASGRLCMAVWGRDDADADARISHGFLIVDLV